MTIHITASDSSTIYRGDADAMPAYGDYCDIYEDIRRGETAGTTTASGWTWRVAPDISAAAAALGRKGGSANTPAQQEARRKNGAKGGRPKTLRYAVRTTDGVVGRYSTLAAARTAAKAEVADTRGATEIGAPAWIDGNDCIEAYTARDGDDHSPVAIITHITR